MSVDNQQLDAQDRSTSFSAAADRPAPPQSVQIFGGVFLVLWLLMLSLIYITRQRQLALKAKLAELDRAFAARP